MVQIFLCFSMFCVFSSSYFSYVLRIFLGHPLVPRQALLVTGSRHRAYTVKKGILDSEAHHNQFHFQSQPVVMKCTKLKMCWKSAPVEFHNTNLVR